MTSVPAYDVAVIGSGLAGGAAAIRLAQAGARVLLLERQRYPAHKLCGEFLSTEVEAAFERLGVGEAIRRAGPHPIHRLVATAPDGTAFEGALPGTALGFSRYRLDALLFEHAQAVGADARDGTAVTDVAGDLERGFRLTTRGGDFRARLVLGAYGKRGRLDRTLGRAFIERHEPYLAVKAHYEGLDLPGTIELHSFDGGYCGLSHVEGGRVNVCWIAHERVLRAAGGRPEAVMTSGACAANPHLRDRVRQMRLVPGTRQAVSQISFAQKPRFAGDVCMIGDTAGMIAPVCGDGMAMALASAELVSPLVCAVLAGDLAPADFRARYAQAWAAAFRTRLRLGRVMHHGYAHPLVAALALRTLRRLPGLARWLIRTTRG